MFPQEENFDGFNWTMKKYGGLGRARPPEPSLEPIEEAIAEPDQPPPPEQPKVILSNPKWLQEEASIGDKVKAAVEIKLPPGHAHLNRVILDLFVLEANGKKEKISSMETHAKDGKAEGEFTLMRPAGTKAGEKVHYVFTAKHRDTKDVESPQLQAVEPARNLICELDARSEITNEGYALVLKGGGKIHTSYKAKDGIREDGILKFNFTEMDPEVAYILELQDEKGRKVAALFSQMKHGDWDQKAGSPE